MTIASPQAGHETAGASFPLADAGHMVAANSPAALTSPGLRGGRLLSGDTWLPVPLSGPPLLRQQYGT